ncbi:hypothetical protein CEN40_14245, partial [Fischerella thermalis CCMEE 5205]
MGLRVLQINFPFNGLWGNEMMQAYSELAHKLSEIPGLLWKIWIENSNDGETGGIYLFEDASSLDIFLTEHIISSSANCLRYYASLVRQESLRITNYLLPITYYLLPITSLGDSIS